MAKDAYPTGSDTVFSAARRSVSIVPGVDPLAEVPKAIHCAGDGGTVKLRLVDDTEDRTIFLNQGQTEPVRPKYVYADGTTATGLVGYLGPRD